MVPEKQQLNYNKFLILITYFSTILKRSSNGRYTKNPIIIYAIVLFRNMSLNDNTIFQTVMTYLFTVVNYHNTWSYIHYFL